MSTLKGKVLGAPTNLSLKLWEPVTWVYLDFLLLQSLKRPLVLWQFKVAPQRFNVLFNSRVGKNGSLRSSSIVTSVKVTIRS